MNNQFKSGGKTIVSFLGFIIVIVALGYKVVMRLSKIDSLTGNRTDNQFMSYSTPRSNLKTLVFTMNGFCPYEDSFGQISSFEYEGGPEAVFVHISIAEKSPGLIETIKTNGYKVEESYLTLYSYSNTSQKSLLKSMSEAGVGMMLCFKDTNFGDSCRLFISDSRVKQAAQRMDVSAMDCVFAENVLLNIGAIETGEDVCLKNVTIEGGYRVFNYQCDDKTIIHLNSMREKRKREMLNSYKSSDGNMDLTKEAGLGYKFRYSNYVSGKECVITIENDEL